MRKSSESIVFATLLVGATLLANSGNFILTTNAQTFFTQPQSHLGRLVQSITSPLMLAAGSGYTGDESSAADAASGSPYDTSEPADAFSPSHQQQHSGENSVYQRYQAAGQRHQAPSMQPLQQAPSQQRGVPQQYRSSSSLENDGDDEGSAYGPELGATGRHFRQRGTSEQQPSAKQEYQMGAYLGPTIDDKEIRGAFNSNNDDRDDDDGAGYVGPPARQSGRQRAVSSYGAAGDLGASPYAGDAAAAAAANGRDYSGFAPNAGEGGSYGPESASSSADEDADEAEGDGGRAPFRGGQRGGLNQAASQYHRQQQPRARINHQLATAANSPYGPIDFNSLMAAANGGQQGGFEVYNGDGSYAGPMGDFQGYGDGQQGGRGNGRRQQAASMSNQFGYGPMSNAFGPNQQQPQQQSRSQSSGASDDDGDADMDED